MHRQSCVTVPIKVIIVGSAHEKGKYDCYCKKTVIFFFFKADSISDISALCWVSHTFCLNMGFASGFCSEEDLLSLCVNTQELVLKTHPQCYERGCKREACGNMAWRNRWLTHPLEHVHQWAALTNWTHRLAPTPWHFVRNWAAECWLFESYRHDGISKFNPLSSGGKKCFVMLDSA